MPSVYRHIIIPLGPHDTPTSANSPILQTRKLRKRRLGTFKGLSGMHSPACLALKVKSLPMRNAMFPPTGAINPDQNLLGLP